MIMIYLVLNLEDDPCVVNVCSTREKANELIEQYQNNFAKNMGYVPEFGITEINPNDTKDILWDCYDNEYCTELEEDYD